MVIHQAYENSNDHPLETLYMMPYSDTFTLSKIIVSLTLENGQVTTLETKVTEREIAKANYAKAIEEGKTAVHSYTASTEKSKPMPDKD